jgi:hypothetical protein
MTPAKAAKLIVKMEEAEAAMFRAFNKWAKLRAQVRRADARMAKESQHVRGGKKIPGQLDVAALMPGGQAALEEYLDGLRK